MYHPHHQQLDYHDPNVAKYTEAVLVAYALGAPLPGQSIDDFVGSSGAIVSGDKFRPLTLHVDNSTGIVNFQAAVEDRQWYPRLCNEVGDVLGKKKKRIILSSSGKKLKKLKIAQLRQLGRNNIVINVHAKKAVYKVSARKQPKEKPRVESPTEVQARYHADLNAFLKVFTRSLSKQLVSKMKSGGRAAVCKPDYLQSVVSTTLRRPEVYGCTSLAGSADAQRAADAPEVHHRFMANCGVPDFGAEETAMAQLMSRKMRGYLRNQRKRGTTVNPKRIQLKDGDSKTYALLADEGTSSGLRYEESRMQHVLFHMGLPARLQTHLDARRALVDNDAMYDQQQVARLRRALKPADFGSSSSSDDASDEDSSGSDSDSSSSSSSGSDSDSDGGGRGQRRIGARRSKNKGSKRSVSRSGEPFVVQRAGKNSRGGDGRFNYFGNLTSVRDELSDDDSGYGSELSIAESVGEAQIAAPIYSGYERSPDDLVGGGGESMCCGDSLDNSDFDSFLEGMDPEDADNIGVELSRRDRLRAQRAKAKERGRKIVHKAARAVAKRADPRVLRRWKREMKKSGTANVKSLDEWVDVTKNRDFVENVLTKVSWVDYRTRMIKVDKTDVTTFNELVAGVPNPNLWNVIEALVDKDKTEEFIGTGGVLYSSVLFPPADANMDDQFHGYSKPDEERLNMARMYVYLGESTPQTFTGDDTAGLCTQLRVQKLARTAPFKATFEPRLKVFLLKHPITACPPPHIREELSDCCEHCGKIGCSCRKKKHHVASSIGDDYERYERLFNASAESEDEYERLLAEGAVPPARDEEDDIGACYGCNTAATQRAKPHYGVYYWDNRVNSDMNSSAESSIGGVYYMDESEDADSSASIGGVYYVDESEDADSSSSSIGCACRAHKKRGALQLVSDGIGAHIHHMAATAAHAPASSSSSFPKDYHWLNLMNKLSKRRLFNRLVHATGYTNILAHRPDAVNLVYVPSDASLKKTYQLLIHDPHCQNDYKRHSLRTLEDVLGYLERRGARSAHDPVFQHALALLDVHFRVVSSASPPVTVGKKKSLVVLGKGGQTAVASKSVQQGANRIVLIDAVIVPSTLHHILKADSVSAAATGTGLIGRCRHHRCKRVGDSLDYLETSTLPYHGTCGDCCRYVAPYVGDPISRKLRRLNDEDGWMDEDAAHVGACACRHKKKHIKTELHERVQQQIGCQYESADPRSAARKFMKLYDSYGDKDGIVVVFAVSNKQFGDDLTKAVVQGTKQHGDTFLSNLMGNYVASGSFELGEASQHISDRKRIFSYDGKKMKGRNGNSYAVRAVFQHPEHPNVTVVVHDALHANLSRA